MNEKTNPNALTSMIDASSKRQERLLNKLMELGDKDPKALKILTKEIQRSIRVELFIKILAALVFISLVAFLSIRQLTKGSVDNALKTISKSQPPINFKLKNVLDQKRYEVHYNNITLGNIPNLNDETLLELLSGNGDVNLDFVVKENNISVKYKNKAVGNLGYMGKEKLLSIAKKKRKFLFKALVNSKVIGQINLNHSVSVLTHGSPQGRFYQENDAIEYTNLDLKLKFVRTDAFITATDALGNDHLRYKYNVFFKESDAEWSDPIKLQQTRNGEMVQNPIVINNPSSNYIYLISIGIGIMDDNKIVYRLRSHVHAFELL